MWADNETSTDLLSIDHLTVAVESVVLNPRLLPVTVGVFGGWGSGKSSIIRMTQDRLEKRDNVLCVSFNGWLFENYEDAKAALMGTILDEVKAKRTLSKKGQDLLTRLLARVDWFRTLGLVGKGVLTFATGFPTLRPSDFEGLLRGDLPEGLDLATLSEKFGAGDAEALTKLVRAVPHEDVRKTIREFHNDFAELIQETKLNALVVFIDDLDRCLPDTIIGTLEAIRLFLFVPQTAFVIGADEDLVYHAVERRFPEARGVRPDVGRDYLEKLIQIPIRVPPLGQREIETYMALLFADLHLGERFGGFLGSLIERSLAEDRAGRIERCDRILADEILSPCPAPLADDLLLVQQTADVLTAGLDGNPRQTKRFLNTLLLRVAMAESRGISLGRRVLAKLMLLEYFRTEAFRLLAGLQGTQDGMPAELSAAERQARGAADFQQKVHFAGEKYPAGDEEGPSDRARPVVTRPTRREAKGRDGREMAKKAPAQEASEEQSAEDLMGTLAKWLNDPWLASWLASDPPLADQDLGPYFYVSRDRLGLYSGPTARMSPAARAVLEGLSSIAKADRIRAAKEAAELSPVDAAAVFESLAERARRAENLVPQHSPFYGLLLLAENRDDLAADLFQFVSELPDTLVPFSAVPQIAQAFNSGATAIALRELIAKWATSEASTQLAAAAKAVLPSLK